MEWRIINSSYKCESQLQIVLCRSHTLRNGNVVYFEGIRTNAFFIRKQQVNEAESYIYSISEARNNPSVPPRWHLHYSFRQAFGLNNFSPAGIDQLVFDISRNRNLGRNLFRYRVKNGDPRMQNGCNDDCLRSQVCTLVTNEHADNRRCNQVLAVFGTVA